jgi:hypothetical protein
MKCVDKPFKSTEEGLVGKVFLFADEARTEVDNYAIIKKLDPKREWSLPMLHSCTIDAPRVTGKCAALRAKTLSVAHQIIMTFGGSTIREAMPCEEHLIIELVEQALHALCKIHDAGYVHMDVKPENILVNADGRLRLIDYGLMTPVDLVYDVSHNGYNLAYEYPYFPPEFVGFFLAKMELPMTDSPLTRLIRKDPKILTKYTACIDSWGLGRSLEEVLGSSGGGGPLRHIVKGMTQQSPASRLSVHAALKLVRNLSGKKTR